MIPGVKSSSLPHSYKGLPSLWSRTVKLGEWQLSSHSPSNLASWNPKHLGFPGRRILFSIKKLAINQLLQTWVIWKRKANKQTKKTFTSPSFISLGFISYDYPRKKLKKCMSHFSPYSCLDFWLHIK